VALEVVPPEPEFTIWEGQLAPHLDPGPEGSKDLLRRRLSLEELETDLPVVSIGKPEVLRSLTRTSPPGYERLGSHDFYLVRFWCSFRAFESDIRFDAAHFRIRLSSSDGADLIAHDMYPAEVLYGVERNVQVSISPEVKFTEFGGKLGGLDYGFSYTELQPAIVAAGQGEATPTWGFSPTKGYALRGGKAVHLVVAAPADTLSGKATLDLTADVRKPGRVPLPFGLFDKTADVPVDPLTVTLW
jgi:hypothetical protein